MSAHPQLQNSRQLTFSRPVFSSGTAIDSRTCVTSSAASSPTTDRETSTNPSTSSPQPTNDRLQQPHQDKPLGRKKERERERTLSTSASFSTQQPLAYSSQVRRPDETEPTPSLPERKEGKKKSAGKPRLIITMVTDPRLLRVPFLPDPRVRCSPDHTLFDLLGRRPMRSAEAQSTMQIQRAPPFPPKKKEYLLHFRKFPL